MIPIPRTLAGAVLVLAACSSPRAPLAHTPPASAVRAPADADALPSPAPTYIGGLLRPDPTLLTRASVAGTVVARGGVPLAGARVCAEEAALGDPRRTQEPSCVLTDTAGHYTIAGLLAGSYTLDANLATYRPNVYEPTPTGGQLDFALGPGEHATDHTLTLSPGAVRFMGQVTDLATGAPLEHAILTLTGTAVRGTARGETDATGHFVVWTDSGELVVLVRASGHAALKVATQAPRVQAFTLVDGGGIIGTVVDATTGAAVADATVTLKAEDSEASDPEPRATSRSGAFAFVELTPGNFHIIVRAPHLYGRSFGAVLVERGKATTGVVVRGSPVARVTGRVLDDMNRPCPGATGSLYDSFASELIPLAPRGTDQLVADAVPPGTYDVSVACPDHHTLPSEAPLVITTTDVGSLTWIAHGGGSIVLRALRPDGTLDEDAIGGITNGWATRYSPIVRDGVIEAHGLAPGPYTLDITSMTWVSPPSASVQIASAQDLVRVSQLGLASRPIRGQLVTATGHPAIGRKITTTAPILGRYYTDEHGEFLIEDLPAGTYTITAPQTDYSDLLGPALPTLHRVTTGVQPGPPVRIALPPARGVITGDVRESDGARAAGVLVAAAVTSPPDPQGDPPYAAPLWYRDSGQLLAITDAKGHFELRQLDGEYYGLSVFRLGQAELNEDFAKVGAHLTLRLPATAQVTGTVTTGDARAPDDFLLTCKAESGSAPPTDRWFRTAGTFHLGELRPASYDCLVRTPTLRGAATVTLAAGAHERTTIALLPLVTVTGRVLDARTGKALAGLWVRMEPGGGSTRGFPDDTVGTETHEDGRFVLREVPAGTIEVSIRAVDHHWIDHRQLELQGTAVDVGDLKIDPSTP